MFLEVCMRPLNEMKFFISFIFYKQYLYLCFICSTLVLYIYLRIENLFPRSLYQYNTRNAHWKRSGFDSFPDQLILNNISFEKYTLSSPFPVVNDVARKKNEGAIRHSSCTNVLSVLKYIFLIIAHICVM